MRKKLPELLVYLGNESIGDMVPDYIHLGLFTSEPEFMSLLEQGRIMLSGERMYPDDLSYVVVNNDVLMIDNHPVLLFVK